MLVYDLQHAPEDAAAVGGKAAGLARLARAALPVPPGFVITAEAFRAFLLHNSVAQPDNDGAALERFRSCLWPDELRSAIERLYGELRARAGEVPVAVRSSATAEDGAGASFAGQHLTVLNVRDRDGVLDSILACWASLYSATALHYRTAKNVEDEAPAMAVVVQALISSDASGVAFTLDPVGGNRDVVVIESAWGLGEGVVSGIVTPDHAVVRKADGAIVRHDVSTKERRVVSAPDGGTSIEELSGELARQAVLSDEQLGQVARMAAQIEEQAGVPQDIEWALAGGTLYILQARPVTSVAGTALVDPPAPPGTAAPPVVEPELPADGWVSEFDTETQPETIWTSANVQEVLPGQMSPFSASVNTEVGDRLGNQPIERFGVKLKTPDPFFAYFYGRPFLNVSMMLEVADQAPFGSIEAMMEQYFGQGRDRIELDVQPKRFSLARLWRYCLIMPRMLWFMLRMPAAIRRAEKIVAAFEQEDAARPFDQQSEDELLVTMDRGLDRGAEVSTTHISGGGLTSSNFEWLRRLTGAWLDDKDGALQARLCTGLAAVESAQPAYELWDLSRIVLASERLRAAFEPADGVEIERRVDALPEAETAAFRARLGEFVAKHGHRSVMEAEPAAKSWQEDLPTVFTMLRNYLHAAPSADPRRIEERQRREREGATKDALRRLRWWQRPVFRYVLREAQNWVMVREHTKSLMVWAIDRGRRATRELASRMVARGLLNDVWDFYEITFDEAKALVRGEMSREEAHAKIERRKQEEERNKRVVLPETFKGRPKPLRPDQQRLPEGRLLRGIAVSPGRVTGRARVIIDPRIDATIEPGEVLVAPVTDAGWTPLFVAAAAIVVDVGGSLSHGSTVAREYGLPAVVNVKHGTRMIRTGQTITVDGTQGLVILDDGSGT